MPTKLLFAIFTVNSVISQLILRRGLRGLRIPDKISTLGLFVTDAALSPWIYASVVLQILSYVMWMIIVSREKLGVAAATVGAGYYVLMAFCAWLVYDERLTYLQCAGIGLVTIGVICISLGGLKI